MTRTNRFLQLAALAAGCATSDATPAKDVSVELAAVTLADDCGRPPPQPARPAKPRPSSPASPSVVAPGDCGGPDCGGHSRCDQTSMQLSFKAPAGATRTTIKIKKVELLDPKGKVLEVLTARSPARWTAEGSYVAWDETIAADQTVASTYELNSPSWDKLTNGRWSAHSKTFQLRVTVTIGSANRTVEKQSITPARLAPPVPT